MNLENDGLSNIGLEADLSQVLQIRPWVPNCLNRVGSGISPASRNPETIQADGRVPQLLSEGHEPSISGTR
mgnify:CR=1 FL=1